MVNVALLAQAGAGVTRRDQDAPFGRETISREAADAIFAACEEKVRQRDVVYAEDRAQEQMRLVEAEKLIGALVEREMRERERVGRVIAKVRANPPDDGTSVGGILRWRAACDAIEAALRGGEG